MLVEYWLGSKNGIKDFHCIRSYINTLDRRAMDKRNPHSAKGKFALTIFALMAISSPISFRAAGSDILRGFFIYLAIE